ncbi:hypothetical protein RA2_03637 [Roseovarius sp. A-2]|nr:hypothetical protein RA2_03637 [Roseovarius sp. A-2]
MSDPSLIAPGFWTALRHIWNEHRVWLASALGLGNRRELFHATGAVIDAPRCSLGTALTTEQP